jgi:hypothetical protein
MASNTQKSYDLGDGESTVLKFRGHPEYDAFRVENDATGEVDVTVYVNTDDELDNVTTGNSTQIESTTLAAGSNYGTEAASRTVLVELVEGTGTGTAGTVYGHNAHDPAENATAFASR